MNSHFKENAQSFKAGGAVTKYQFVKFGAGDDLVVQCSADDEAAIGVAMDSAASGELLAVALPGAGALVKLSATITRGDNLATSTTGTGKAGAAGGYVNAVAMQSGVSGDVIAVMVTRFQLNP